MIPYPNLTLTITPPGGSPGSYQKYLAWSGAENQLSITQNFGRQGDTATMPLVDDWGGRSTPNFYIPVLSQIALYDNTIAQSLFAGVVNDPTLCVLSPTLNEWTLSCTDYTFYADNSVPVFGIFNNVSIDEIVVALTEQANCGISAATISDGGFVAPAPTVTTITFNYVSLSSAWKTLAQLAGSVTPYGWYVDQNLQLHFYDSSTAVNSGVVFTTTPTTGGSIVEGHFAQDSNFGYEWDGTTIHNLILVQGATQTINQPTTGNRTVQFLGDGATSVWALPYTPDTGGSPTLTLNGVSTALVIETNGQVDSTSPWAFQQNADGTWFLIALTAPSAGTMIQIWYDYQIPIIAQSSSAASQAAYTGPNRGIYGEFINDQSLSTTSEALARAQSEKTEYAFAAERLSFTTTSDWIGWVRAGETFQAVNQFIPDSQNSYTWGLSDMFIAVSNTVTWGQDEVANPYRTMNITAVRI
jgi:hypothetical protein